MGQQFDLLDVARVIEHRLHHVPVEHLADLAYDTKDRVLLHSIDSQHDTTTRGRHRVLGEGGEASRRFAHLTAMRPTWEIASRR